MDLIDHTQKKLGFTLLELAIVLVIVGLIVAGIFVGRDLIDNAKLRQQVKQIEQYSVAYTTFKIKYNCIPGDCARATSLFSGTIDGNGNGILQNGTNLSGDALYATTYFTGSTSEIGAFFQQLSLANLIPGNFTRTTTLNIGYPSTAIDSGKGFVPGSFFYNVNDWYSWAYSYPISSWNVGLFFILVNPSLAGGDWSGTNNYGILTPLQASNIDSKIDDGSPSSGRFMGFPPYGRPLGECDNYSTNRTRYNVSNTQTACQFSWKLD